MKEAVVLSHTDAVQSQSTELPRGTTELVQHFRLLGEFTSAQQRRLTYILYGLALSLTYPSWEEGQFAADG
jgi:hypothetical protein